MTATPSTMLAIGTAMPSFRLPDFDGREVSSADFAKAPAMLVAFLCPHCPFVRHVRAGFSTFASEYRARGLAIVGINSNDVEAFPDDGPAGMRHEAETAGYTFPYLFDETQQAAKDFQAACTPDLFLFDGARRLAYRGQFDDSRPRGTAPVTGRDIRDGRRRRAGRAADHRPAAREHRLQHQVEGWERAGVLSRTRIVASVGQFRMQNSEFRNFLVAGTVMLALAQVPLLAQWLAHPERNAPRRADGTVNLDAPTPRTRGRQARLQRRVGERLVRERTRAAAAGLAAR